MSPYKGKRVFVQIAAYRDKELLPTLKDMLDKADEPNTLHVCIAWQHNKKDKWDQLDEYINDERFTIIDLDAAKSKGACWARNLIQQKYKSEDFTLQLDSHHRFVEGWDTILKNTFYSLQLSGVKKPLLTGYLPSYDPETGAKIDDPWRLRYQRFAPEGPLHTIPETIPDWKDHTGPLRARFYSAHFCFTLGKFSKEVQHDPKLYFHGEEITIAVRAFTHGYDLFHMHIPIMWHYYQRSGNSKHWDDHNQWGKLNDKSYARVRKLLGINNEKFRSKEEVGKYGLGKARSLDDYERYAGIRFSDKGIQQYTKDNFYPPNPILKEGYDESFLNLFKFCIDVNKDLLKGETDFICWALAFEDKNGKEMFRQDVTDEEIKNTYNSNINGYQIWREFATKEVPYKWIVWPQSKEKGWLDRIEGIINNE
jgi:hypothetical protein